jgi:hypothetical protein
MSNIKATVTQNGKTLAKVTPQQNILVTNYQVSTSTITLDDLVDVQIGNNQDGALLVYDATNQIWRAQTVIENPNTEINGGFF